MTRWTAARTTAESRSNAVCQCPEITRGGRRKQRTSRTATHTHRLLTNPTTRGCAHSHRGLGAVGRAAGSSIGTGRGLPVSSHIRRICGGEANPAAVSARVSAQGDPPAVVATHGRRLVDRAAGDARVRPGCTTPAHRPKNGLSQVTATRPCNLRRAAYLVRNQFKSITDSGYALLVCLIWI